jgi:lipopolysaccharide export system protein LptC
MQRLRLIAILVAGSLLVLWLFDQATDDPTVRVTDADSPLAADYDYYVSAMRTTRFSADGQPVYRMQATRLTHFPDGDVAVLEAPEFLWYGEEAQPWQVNAGSGTLRPDAERSEDRLDLQRQVLLRREAADGNFLEIRTEELTVFPAAEEALTAAPVNVLTRTTRLESTGLRALLAQDRIDLLNDVRGTHDQTPLP